ncbi:MAG: DUF616 domain-containing protein [Chloroflexota bacterium]
MRVVVITAITGRRDRLKDRQNVEGADFVAFADRAYRSSTWDVRPAASLFRDPVRNAKIHKVLPHLYFPDYDYSLWIDGSVELVDPAPLLVERYLGDRDLVFGRHPVHNSVEDELTACYREVFDDPALIQAQESSISARDATLGAPLAGVILRRHCPSVTRFNDAWWALICRWSRRDQLSVLDAATGAGVRWGYVPRQRALTNDPIHELFGSPHFRWYPHGHEVPPEDDVPLFEPHDAAPPVWWHERLAFVEAVSGQREAHVFSLLETVTTLARRAEAAEQRIQVLEAELASQALPEPGASVGG